ncbi:hypothetical protein ACNKHM_04675 [Shigella sonnei]
MHQPMPEVFFTAFGVSTLDYELRLYVNCVTVAVLSMS